jgi:hypothetical protein
MRRRPTTRPIAWVKGEIMNRRRAASVAFLVVSIAALAIAIAWQPGGTRSDTRETGITVVLVGIDGLDWFLLSRYVEEGRMPTCARLLASSMQAEITPALPPARDAGWTAVARGRGLSDAELAALEGGGGGRLLGIAPDVALAAHRAGKSALSIGWPASWPSAESGPMTAAPYAPSATPHELSLTPTFFTGAPGQASSHEMADRIDEAVARNERLGAASFAHAIYGGPPPADATWREHMAAARWGHLADMIVLDLAAALIAEREPDLALVHLGGLDAVEHRFLAPAMPSFFTGSSPPEEYAEVLPNYYGFLDDALERVLRLCDERTLIIVCSAYGVHPWASLPTVSGAHREAPPGVLIVRGPNLPARDALLRATPADLAPTVLAAIGVPIPSEMDGRMLVGALPSWLLERFPADYEPIALERPEPPPGVEPSAVDVAAGERFDALLDEFSR